jgi:hypothetical protein
MEFPFLRRTRKLFRNPSQRAERPDNRAQHGLDRVELTACPYFLSSKFPNGFQLAVLQFWNSRTFSMAMTAWSAKVSKA